MQELNTLVVATIKDLEVAEKKCQELRSANQKLDEKLDMEAAKYQVTEQCWSLIANFYFR